MIGPALKLALNFLLVHETDHLVGRVGFAFDPHFGADFLFLVLKVYNVLAELFYLLAVGLFLGRVERGALSVLQLVHFLSLLGHLFSHFVQLVDILFVPHSALTAE